MNEPIRKKPKPLGINQNSTTLHAENAKRFVEICAIFDKLKVNFRYEHQSRSRLKPDVARKGNYTDLKWLLSDLVHRHKIKRPNKGMYRTRTGERHRLAQSCPHQHGRKNIPKPIRQFAQLQNSPLPEKLQLTWIVCYLHRIRPNQNEKGWECFDCSHRCVSYNLPDDIQCISRKCLCWESKHNNQSRGFMVENCTKECCCKEKDYICRCRGIHVPCCI